MPAKPQINPQVFWDEWNFVLGVGNVMLSSWLVGSFPWTYWIYHFIKLLVLLCLRAIRFSEKKRQFWMLDYCYFINYSIMLFYILSIAGVLQNNQARIAFRVLFTSCVGPLAMSVPCFRNSLVFHSSDQITILAIHLSPNIAVWGMRWFPGQLDNHFPGMFDIGCGSDPPDQIRTFFGDNSCEAPFVDLYLWALFVYVVCWAAPYYIFFFLLGKSALRRGGYYTMFEDMRDNNPIIKKVINTGGSWGQVSINARCLRLM
jgi:hypothetical protein